MPTFNIANDGHYFVVGGYRITLNGEEDAIFATYQVVGSAHTLFATEGFRSGRQVSREIFYAMLLDRGLTTAALDLKRFTVDNLPNDIRNNALKHDKDARRYLQPPETCQTAYDFYKSVSPSCPGGRLHMACHLSIARHWRQHLADNPRPERGPIVPLARCKQCGPKHRIKYSIPLMAEHLVRSHGITASLNIGDYFQKLTNPPA